MRGGYECQQREPCCVSAPVHYDATDQRGCHRWANGDFLGSGDGHGPAQLPVAEEWNGGKWRDFFLLYDPSYDGCGQSRAVHGIC